MKKIKLAVVGSRSILNYSLVNDLIHKTIKDYLKEEISKIDLSIVSGGAIGVDSSADKFSKRNAITFIEHKPEYKKYGKKLAPLKRNDKIVNFCDILLCIWDGESTGCIDAYKKAKKLGKPLYLFNTKIHSI